MNAIDIIICIPLLWFAYKGFSKGLVVAIASLAALLLGIYGAINFSNVTSNVLTQRFEMNSEYLPVISFAVTFIVIVILVHFVAKLIDKLIKAVSLSLVNKLLGAAFSMLKIAVIISVVLILVERFSINSSFISEEMKEESLLYKPLYELTPTVYPSIKELIENSSTHINQLDSISKETINNIEV